MIHTIAALYRFFPLADPDALAAQLHAAFDGSDLRGTLLIAPEGINGTLAASAATIDRLLDFLAKHTGLDRADVKFASSEEAPFGRLKFRVKQEIIAFRRAKVDPSRPGKYVQPREWNQLLADGETLLLDTRNTYESEMGTFAGAVTPKIDTFSEFADYVRQNLDPARHRRVAMFCTGGIRCEKASAFMLQEGFEEVYHLQGGILRYLEEVPETDSQWQGACYVFDRRVAVTHADYSNDNNQ